MIVFDARRDGAGGWALVSDRVMGGRSDGALRLEEVAGRAAVRMTGEVSLENDGGFLQMARDMAPAPGSGFWSGATARPTTSTCEPTQWKNHGRASGRAFAPCPDGRQCA